MKILIVRSYCPQKIFYGGDMRVSQFVDYFRRFAQLDLLTLTKPFTGSDPDYIQKTFNRYYYFESAPQKPDFISKYVHLLPWQLTQFYSPQDQEKFNEIVSENNYDLIFVSKLEPLLYLLRLPKKWHEKVVIDFDDILSDLYSTHYTSSLTARKNSFFLKINETKALKAFKRIFICTPVALQKIDKKYHDKVGIIPNIYPYAKNELGQPANKDRLLCVGSLDYFPNTEGLKWFFDTIWPKAKEAFPDLKFTVVGKTQKDISALHASFGNPRDVEIFTNAPSVVPHYQNAFASIVPLLNGSGTRLKILESAAYGRPVLTTLKGMEGLDFEADRNILLFDGAESFIASFRKLLDERSYGRFVESASQVLKNAYSQDAFQKNMDENWKIFTDKAHAGSDGNSL